MARAIAAAADVGMGYWTEAELPFYYGLARAFPVADRWFSSCLGPTFPNRRFLIAGTAHGLIDDSPYDLLDYPSAGTIFDMLSRHGISWANYHPDRRPASPGCRTLRAAQAPDGPSPPARRSSRSLPGGDQRACRRTCSSRPTSSRSAIGQYMQHVHSTDQFFADADNGTLPAFSIVDPDFNVFSEENPQDIRKGESFAAEVINRVMHGKGWPDTLLIWLYDEHGGYYDHVPPPPAVPPDDVEGRSLIGQPGQAAGRPAAAVSRRKVKVEEQPGRRARTATTGTGSGCRRSWCRRTRAAITSAARCSTTPPCSSWWSRSGTCRR